MPKRRDANARKVAIVGETTPTSVGDTVTDETLAALNQAVVNARREAKAAKRAAKRQERQASVDKYNETMARRQTRRGRR